MALDQTTTAKLGDWFNTYSTPAPAANTGGGMLNTSSFDGGSGVFGIQTATAGTPTPLQPTMLNLGDLDRRTVDAPKETVSGQMTNLLDANSSYIQGARERTARAANGRGLLNSSMAASAGEEAAISAALPIAQADAGVFGKASDYNTALNNQGRMYNADAANAFTARQTEIAANTATQQSDQATKLTLAQMQSGLEQKKIDAAREDTEYKNNQAIVNNTLFTTDLSPDRKAAILKELGEPGLAEAIYVIESTAPDLNQIQKDIASGVYI